MERIMIPDDEFEKPMSSQILKELLKPPFSFDNSKLYFDEQRTYFIELYAKKWEEEQKLISLEDFIASALNEKWERDFGEPLRWIRSRSLGVDWIDCPKCKHGLQEGTKDLNYCPHCDQRLLPPEEDKEIQ